MHRHDSPSSYWKVKANSLERPKLSRRCPSGWATGSGTEVKSEHLGLGRQPLLAGVDSMVTNALAPADSVRASLWMT
jgi:hypothetical protein